MLGKRLPLQTRVYSMTTEIPKRARRFGYTLEDGQEVTVAYTDATVWVLNQYQEDIISWLSDYERDAVYNVVEAHEYAAQQEFSAWLEEHWRE